MLKHGHQLLDVKVNYILLPLGNSLIRLVEESKSPVISRINLKRPKMLLRKHVNTMLISNLTLIYSQKQPRLLTKSSNINKRKPKVLSTRQRLMLTKKTVRLLKKLSSSMLNFMKRPKLLKKHQMQLLKQ